MAGGGREVLLKAATEHLAEHGTSNQSLRGIAEAIGTSHRMLIYHFGSREGLLTEIVDLVEWQQREAVAAMDGSGTTDLRTAMRDFWSVVSDDARRVGPFFFEMSAHAMQGHAHAEALRERLVDPWLELLTTLLVDAGLDPGVAEVRARLALGAVRGLLHDALVTGAFDRAGVAAGELIDLILADAPGDAATG